MSQNLEKQLTLLDQLQASCTHCGLCSEACVTFQASGWEQESPRGRIRLARDFMDGKIEPTSAALQTFDRCLGCRACETLCPVSVEYGKIRNIVQQLRSDLDLTKPQKLYQQWIRAAYRIGSRFWRFYGRRWIKLDFLPFKQQKSYLKQKGRYSFFTSDLTLVVGCVQDLYDHQVIEDAIQVLTFLGYRVCIARNQPCCGAVLGRLSQEDQEKRKKVFLNWLPQDAYFLSMGCQCVNQSERKDLYQLILSTLQNKNLKLTLPESQVVYYQPYCNQSKDLENDPVWCILSGIKGLKLKLLPHYKTCCGGYQCNYLFNSQYSREILQLKLKDLPENSTVIVTSFDCQGQFLTYVERDSCNVLYAIQLIAQLIVKNH